MVRSVFVRALWLLPLVWPLAAACSSTSTNADSKHGSGSISLDDLPAAGAKVICANAKACYGPAIQLLTQGEDCDAYVAAYLEDAVAAPIKASIAEGKLAYDPTLGGDCLKTLEGYTKQSPPVCPELDKAAEECKVALVGLQPKNAGCTHGFECGMGLKCDTSNGCSCQPFLALGAPCSSSSQCAVGLTCYIPQGASGTNPGTCTPYAAPEQPCTNDGPLCSPGNFCVGGKCRVLSSLFTGAEGETCFSNSKLCKTDLACEFTGLVFFTPGTCIKDQNHPSCHLGFPDSCDPTFYCNAGALDGTCTALPTSGACAKDTAQSWGLAPACAPGRVCVGGTCLPRKRLGQDCVANEQCASTQCATTCVSPTCS